MEKLEIKSRTGVIESITPEELRARCVSGKVDIDTPVRRSGTVRWEWAIDLPGMTRVFALPKVRWEIPAIALPCAVLLTVGSFLLDGSAMGHHPKGGAESVALLLFFGGVSAFVGFVVPVLEYLKRRMAMTRLDR